MNILSKIINLILPPQCYLCGRVLKTDKGLCNKCISEINFINGIICYRCGTPLYEVPSGDNKHLLCGGCLQKKRHLFRFSRSSCVYDEISKKLILDFKFHDKTDLAPFLAKMMYVAAKDIFASGVDVIIPVPMHYTRMLKRRYNQASLLAKELGKLSNTKVNYTTVVKIKKTKPQAQCSGFERIKNIKDAFYVKNCEDIRNKRVLLVDDVLTTGSTLRECALAIKKAKPKSIDSLTITRVVS